jgi:hypothetical protein
MTERALELLNLPAGRPSFLLDIGCGSGLSGEVLSEYGHEWVGMVWRLFRLLLARRGANVWPVLYCFQVLISAHLC